MFFDAPSTGSANSEESYKGVGLDITEIIAPQKASTFFMQVGGNAMWRTGIFTKDIVTVDRSVIPSDGDVVVATIENDFVIRRLRKSGLLAWLETDGGRKFYLNEESSVEIWGVVTFSIHRIRE